MTNHDLRLKCLELAMRGTNVPFHDEGIVQRAEVLLKFVQAGDQASEVKPVPPEERGNTAIGLLKWLPVNGPPYPDLVDIIHENGKIVSNVKSCNVHWAYAVAYRPAVVLS